MPSDPRPDPEPARPFATVRSAQIRISCACGRQLLLTAASPVLRCACGKHWSVQATATITRDASNPDGDNAGPPP